MPAQIIDGRAQANKLLARCKHSVAQLQAQHDRVPCLTAVLVGDDPASHTYVRNKARVCKDVGMVSQIQHLPASTRQDELIGLIKQLNADDAVHGILVQLPLPSHIKADAILAAIQPAKDVDGLHPANTLKLYAGARDGFVPCTPQGCLILLLTVHPRLNGLHAVIIGRSHLVGKPLAHLLLQQDCSVTVLHSHSRHPNKIAAGADILISAVGQPQLVQADWIKSGATVIDVGINRRPNGKPGLCGDVAFEAGVQQAGAITPVPGGVGPMTIACLMQNCIQAFIRQQIG